jgi:hypothetical protein
MTVSLQAAATPFSVFKIPVFCHPISAFSYPENSPFARFKLFCHFSSGYLPL